MRLLFILLSLLFSTASFADQFIVEPDMGRAPILDFIHQSQHQLKVVMYDFTDKSILNALLHAPTRGVTVECLLEKSPYKNESINQPAIASFNQAHLNWKPGDPRYQFTHQKTMISDDQKAMIMTFNFTLSSFKNQRNFGVIIDNPAAIRVITDVFNADWTRSTSAASSPTLLFSPTDSRTGYLRWFQSAHSSLRIYAQSVADNEIAQSIASAAERGVSVRLITSKLPPKRIASLLASAGVQTHLSKKLYIHAKAVLIDEHVAIIGSVNFTNTSLDKNRELALVSTAPQVIQGLSDTFNQDWQQDGRTNIETQPFQRTTHSSQARSSHWISSRDERRVYHFIKKLFH